MDGILNSLLGALEVSGLVFVMMVAVDLVNAVSRGKLTTIMHKGGARQYTVASFLGVIPGCLGAFLNVSFYIEGVISFGAMTGGMIATSGDAAFVMLSLFPEKAILLFVILFILGALTPFIVDPLMKKFKGEPCDGCEPEKHHKEKCIVFRHYIKEHVWHHIVRKHVWRIFLWSFAALLLVRYLTESFDLSGFVASHMVWVLLIALLFGIIPDSGPQIIIVLLFSKGLIPFSVLLAGSIAQSGHGLLPLLSHSVKESVIVKAFGLILGLAVGLALYLAGY